ncbi:MAG: Gfo/Idh/MocA family oxidoreductase [Bifidobacteriaceae bacterium]|jgi:myo-inositol 2-dehydrogenase/D-chiro-inositol 1-dehydrogenase/scyllo-inositol 2-dehydrogenase (NAD+)|nr:Gfo/Idh/MocA family oxidoreductase [Bifidobacteriaceae bacterium]
MTVKQVLMVGAGRVGRLHTTSITERLGHRAQVTALVDPATEVAQTLATDFGIGHVYATLEEALAGGTYDGVVITTPTFTHRDLAITSLRAGLDVHLEKPMAMNLVECRQITAAVQASGRRLQLGFMRRFDKDFQAAAELLASGQIGRPMIIKSMTHGPGLPPAWANDIRTSNGLIAEVTSHDLDTIGWFAGAVPDTITVKVANFKGAERGVDTPNFYDTMLATVTFTNGVLASVAGVCPADYGYDSRVEVTATKGMVEVGDTGPGGLAVVVAGQGTKAEAVYPSWRVRFAEAYVREMAGFVDAMEGVTPAVGAAEGEQAVALVVAGVQSLLEGRTVALSEVTANPTIPGWQV